MQNIPLLICGDSTDGPVEEFVNVDSLDHVMRLFGAYQYESINLASGSTGYTLSNTPWGSDIISTQYDSTGQLVEKRLYDFRTSGSVLTWSPPGDTITGTIIFRVLTVPSGTALVRGIMDTARSGADITVVRLGGTHGTASGSGFNFTALYAGSRYNGTTITITGGVVTVTPSPGTGRVKTYRPSSDVDFRTQLSDEAARGTGPVLLDVPPSSTSFTLAAGTYTVTGGTNGQLTPEAFLDFVSTTDLDGVDVICPIGLTTDQLVNAGVMDIFDGTQYPTLVVAQAAVSGVALTGVINTSRYLVSTGFSVTTEAGSPRERIDAAAPLLAAIISTHSFGSTLAALPEFPPIPTFDASTMSIIAASGHTIAYKSISKSWALWHVNTGDPVWSVSTVRAYQEIVRPVYEILEPVIGQVLIDEDTLNSLLSDALSSVTGSQVVNWNLSHHADTVYMDIEFRPYGEVRSIQGKVILGSAVNASP